MYKVYKNTVKVSKECAKELYEAQKSEEFWIDEDDVIDYHGYLNIASDNITEINCLDIFNINKSLLPILRKHKVSGEINAGYITTDYEQDIFWGYVFNKGVVTTLIGELIFKTDY
jgi:hypothetical protein